MVIPPAQIITILPAADSNNHHHDHHTVLWLDSAEEHEKSNNDSDDSEKGPVLCETIVPGPPSADAAPFVYPAQQPPAHLSPAMTHIDVVVSTHAGTRRAPAFFNRAVRPLLARLGIIGADDDNDNGDGPVHVHTTTSADSIAAFARSTLWPRAAAGQHQTVILLCGDGGLVDLLTTCPALPASSSAFTPPTVALLPLGTGNATAMSAHDADDATWGLAAFVRGSPRPLPTFRARCSPGARYVTDEGRGREPIGGGDDDGAASLTGCVVLSWGLHASLVADSDTEAYRRFSNDRFKMAATELLFPGGDGAASHAYHGTISIYKKQQQQQQQQQETKPNNSSSSDRVAAADPHSQKHKLNGDTHMYVLLTFASHLERTFTISPASRPLDGRLRLVHFAPVAGARAMEIMMLAYQGGRHVAEPEVDYDAVDGLRIDVDEPDERWRRICVDGSIVALEEKGWVEVWKEDGVRVRLLA